MLHKEQGGYDDIVRQNFTSIVYTALAEECDVICGECNLAAQCNFTGKRDTDFTTSLCVEVLEAGL